MEEFNFTEDEIREQLENLGYSNVPTERLTEFKRDLEALVRHEKSTSINSSSSTETSTSAWSDADHGYGQYRPPLDEASNHSLPTTHYENQSTFEHRKYGKENVDILQIPSQRYESTKNTYYPPPAIFIPTGRTDLGKQPGQKRDAPYTFYSDIDTDTSHVEAQTQPKVLADTTLDTTASSERRQIKRKVLRKRDGESHIFDESVTETEPDDLTSIRERLNQLRIPIEELIDDDDDDDHVGPSSARQYSSNQYHYHVRRPQSAPNPPSYRLPNNYGGPKALIRPMTGNPHMKNIKKSDPVSKYQQYRQNWNCHKAPGEKLHKDLRWGVREHMLYHDQVVQKKHQKVYVPNSYVVPSDKKRKNLRWQIRNDLAQGVKPPSQFD